MGRKTTIKALPIFNVLTGPAVNAQSRQFPGISVSGENERQADFIFRKQAKGSRKAMFDGKFWVKGGFRKP